MNLTPQPPPFPCQPAPSPDSALGLPWATVGSNGRSGRACGSQERAGPLLWVLSPFTLSFILYSYLHFNFLLLICFLPSVLCNLSLYGSLYFFPRLGLSPQSPALPCCYPEHLQCFLTLGQDLALPSFANKVSEGRSGTEEQAMSLCQHSWGDHLSPSPSTLTQPTS